MRRVYLLFVAALFAGGLLVPSTSQAQDQLCFNVPGITNCISGRIREYWEQNGGLPVFGYPITPAQNEVNPDTGQTYLTQWFERNRFEVHPENARPYDVLLGRLGDARLKQQGRNWWTFPKGQQQSGCLWFPETEHSVCDNTQVSSSMAGCPGNVCPTGFAAYWSSHGLLDPALSEFAQSLALFGLPLSEPTVETNQAGDTVVTQWFERARFEFHPNNPPESRVLLGLLGNEIRSGAGGGGGGDGNVDLCAAIAPPRLANIEPNCIRYGDEFYVEFYGFEANEEIGLWITNAETGLTANLEQTMNANAQGRLGGTVDTTDLLPPGNYIFVAQDTAMEREPSTAPFRVIR